MSVESIDRNLECWPNLQVLLRDYLNELAGVGHKDGEPWLLGAAKATKDRQEMAAQFAALELAAEQCDEEARDALSARLVGILSGDKTNTDDHDAQLLDALVELAAYGWLCREYPQTAPRFVPRGKQKTPDLDVLRGGEPIGIECKNLGMSKGVAEALARGAVVPGPGGISKGFVNKLQSTVCHAVDQLQKYSRKIIFVNYTPDPGFWVAEEVEDKEVEATFCSAAPSDATLVVFRNYDWTAPRHRSDCRS